MVKKNAKTGVTLLGYSVIDLHLPRYEIFLNIIIFIILHRF